MANIPESRMPAAIHLLLLEKPQPIYASVPNKKTFAHKGLSGDSKVHRQEKLTPNGHMSSHRSLLASHYSLKKVEDRSKSGVPYICWRRCGYFSRFPLFS